MQHGGLAQALAWSRRLAATPGSSAHIAAGDWDDQGDNGGGCGSARGGSGLCWWSASTWDEGGADAAAGSPPRAGGPGGSEPGGGEAEALQPPPPPGEGTAGGAARLALSELLRELAAHPRSLDHPSVGALLSGRFDLLLLLK
jgi:hypothetical protein